MYYKYLLHRLKYYKYPGLSRDQLSLFSAFTDYDNLLLAHKSASHNKHFYAEVKMVNSDKLFYISHIQDLLLSKTFHTSPYEIFDRYEGSKLRHIYKLPYYPDRIVQWGLIQVIGERIISNLTRDTYSSIRGRGPLACLMKLRRDMQYDPENTKYYLKMDVQKFYPSINHDILKEKYCRLFKDKDILDVIFEIIDSVPPNEGVPIGNLLSQYSGNLYLSSFDHWMKEVLHVKHYTFTEWSMVRNCLRCCSALPTDIGPYDRSTHHRFRDVCNSVKGPQGTDAPCPSFNKPPACSGPGADTTRGMGWRTNYAYAVRGAIYPRANWRWLSVSRGKR